MKVRVLIFQTILLAAGQTQGTANAEAAVQPLTLRG